MILVACSGQKLDHAAPARELYTGDLFRKSAAWAAKRDNQWCILSAEHHLIFQDRVIEPYDTRMKDVDRDAWNAHIKWQLRHLLKVPCNIIVLAGNDYCGWCPSWVRRPLKGLGIGQQKKWLLENL